MEGMHGMAGMKGDHNNHMKDSIGGHMDHGSMSHMDMMMYFHTEIGMDRILFKNWMPMNTRAYILACFLVVLGGFLHEGLKYFREVVRYWQSEQSPDSFKKYLLSRYHLFQTLLHAFQYFLSYCLMLVAMTFQVYLFFSIIVGAALGFLIFTPLTAKLRAEYTNFSEPCC